MQRAVELLRRELVAPRLLGVDETSLQKRHEYLTVVADIERGVVHHVADGRGREAQGAYYTELGEGEHRDGGHEHVGAVHLGDPPMAS